MGLGTIFETDTTRSLAQFATNTQISNRLRILACEMAPFFRANRTSTLSYKSIISHSLFPLVYTKISVDFEQFREVKVFRKVQIHSMVGLYRSGFKARVLQSGQQPAAHGSTARVHLSLDYPRQQVEEKLQEPEMWIRVSVS